MISDAEDVCPWCKKPFDVYFVGVAPAKAGPKKASIGVKISKGAAAAVAILIAVWSLAHVRTAPDGASNNSVVTAPRAQGIASNGPSNVAATLRPLGQENNYQQPRYEPTFIRDSGPQRTGAPSLSNSQQNTPRPAATAKLASININTSNDHEGSETALGSVLIVNQSDMELSDFQLMLVVNNSPTPLVPFEGDINYPMPMTSMRIPPHGRLQVQVGTPSRYGAADIGARSVQLVAHFADGSSYTDKAQLH